MTPPYYDKHGVTVHAGDCLDVLAGLPDSSVHAVCTDPPYGIRFMGKAWDGEDIETGVATRRAQAPMPDDGKAGANGGYRSAAAEAGRYDLSANAAFGEWCRQWAAECLRVLKPGGHMMVFGGSRTWHRLAAAVEDAGFEIRDSIAWLYASGFPKSLDVSKAIDKAAGVERPVVGSTSAGASSLQRASRVAQGYRPAFTNCTPGSIPVTAPATERAAQWQGWGTALKPAFEPIVVARKPLAGTVAGNVQEHGTGALNIEGCRVAGGSTRRSNTAEMGYHGGNLAAAYETGSDTGRWPSNVVLTHTPLLDPDTGEAIGDACADGCVDGCPVRDLDEQSGRTVSRAGVPRGGAAGNGWRMTATGAEYDDAGGASRFFPVFRFEAKAPTSERPRVDGVAHPTVKPLALMRWLVRLVTPPAGVVLDPFLGSGATAQAARAEGFRCVGIEREETYLPLIRYRLDGDGIDLFGGVA